VEECLWVIGVLLALRDLFKQAKIKLLVSSLLIEVDAIGPGSW